MNPRGYQTYKQQSVSTMTKDEMLLLLYDELLKRLAKARIALEKEDYSIFEESVQRSKDIVKYLIETLNYEYPISRELKNMYDYFLYELSRLQAGRHPEIIQDLHGLIKDMRDAFTQASRQSHGLGE